MSERLQIDAAFETATAAEAAARLIALLDELRRVAAAVGQDVGAAERKVADMGAAAQSTGGQVSNLARYTGEAKQTTQDFTGAQQNLYQQLNQTNTVVNNSTTIINNQARATKEATESTSGLVGAIASLGASYFSLRGAIAVAQELELHTRNAINARRELAGEKLSLDETVRPLLVNKGLEGPDAERRAVGMVLGTVGRTGATPQQVVSGLSAGQAAGFNVDLDKGSAPVEEVIAFARRANITSGPAFDGLMRLMKTRQDRDGKAFDPAQFIAEVQTGFGQSAVQNIDQYVSNMIRATQARGEMGGSWQQGLALYSAAIQTMKDPELASTGVETLSRLAAGKSGKSLEMLGSAAARYGFIPSAGGQVDSIMASELSRQTAAPDKAEAHLVDQIGSEERRLQDMRDAEDKQERAYRLQKDRIAVERRRAHRPDQRRLLDEQEANLDASHAVGGRESTDRLSEATRKIAEHRASLHDDILLRLNQANFEQLDQDTKEQVILRLLADSGDDPAVRDWLISSGIVEGRSIPRLIALGGKSGQAKMESTRRALAGASGATVTQQREQYGRTAAGGAALSAAGQTGLDVAAVAAGGESAETFLRRVQSIYRREKQDSGDRVGFFAGIGGLFGGAGTFSEEGQLGLIGARELAREFYAFLRGLTPAQLADPAVKSLIQEWDASGIGSGSAEGGAHAPFMGAGALNSVQRMAERLFHARQQIQSRGATTRPTTRPAGGGEDFSSGVSSGGDFGPQSSATIINNYHSIGNLFSGGTEAPDLPGRLEGIA